MTITDAIAQAIVYLAQGAAAGLAFAGMFAAPLYFLAWLLNK